MKDLVSIIIPIYKVEEYLDRCVSSVVKQTYQNIEIILVDDGSPDRCPELCDAWGKKDARIRVIHKENGGLSSARNVGILEATGKYILFVDSDDCIDENACEKLLNYADDVDLVVAEATIYYEDNQITHRVHTNLTENYVYTGTECALKEIEAGEWFAAACYNMYKREFLLNKKLFFVEGILHEDIDYLPRLFLAAETVKYMHYEFYKYIIRGSSICGTKSAKHFTDLLGTYTRWLKLNDTIEDENVKKVYAGALSKYFMASCREHKVKKHIYPDGMNGAYLIKNALNAKERIKAIAFVMFRTLYVQL